jgi:hypothetical protein
MKQSGVVWNDQNLDRYFENPPKFIPGNHMTFPGIGDGKVRADIIAYLKTAGGEYKMGQAPMGGMGGMQRGVPKLKSVDASSCVKEHHLLSPRHHRGW